MALSLFTTKKRIVNIVINDHSIRYIELKSPNEAKPLRYRERFIPQGLINNGKIIDYETLVTILEQCVAEWKIKNRQIRFLVPESLVIIRKIEIPIDVNDDEIKGYLYLELGSSIHLPFDDPVFDAVVLSQNTEKKEILLFAAQEEIVQEYVELFQDVKLKPIEAEVSPLSLYRLYYKLNQPNTEEDILVVQFNLDDVNICIFEKTIPFFMHHLQIEFNQEKWEMRSYRKGTYQLFFHGDVGDLSFELDDVYKEINRLMDFYRYSLHQGKKQLARILLSGDHPLLSQIKHEMERRFELPIETIKYEAEEELPHAFYLVLGLGLKGVQ